MSKKQHEFFFIALMAFCAMSTGLTLRELIIGSPGVFVASLGPFIAGWFLHFRVRKIMIEGRKSETQWSLGEEET